ncbi:MAG: 50S ribosomal protein L11 methyltransferase [Prevotella sp.]|nr:50S ribosomal protein L11 methyltransferase [Prevotella sp.]
MKYFEVQFHISAPDGMLQDVKDVVAAMAGEAGFETFEDTDDGLTGYVQRELFDETALSNALEQLPFGEEMGVSVDYHISEAPDRDWNEQWEQEGFDPILVGTHLIIYDGRHLPSTLNPQHSALSLSTLNTQHSTLNPQPLTIQIEARQAFGTGNHATTRMMCQALMDLGLEGKTILDCGTGTGILSIVALKCGAECAVGYDIDEWSVENARHNAALNGVEQQFTSVFGNATVIRQLQRKFDVVAANINRNILLADMPLMRQALPQYRGTLLLSGFYREDVPQLIAKAHSLGLHLEDEKGEDGWSMLQFRVK